MIARFNSEFKLIFRVGNKPSHEPVLAREMARRQLVAYISYFYVENCKMYVTTPLRAEPKLTFGSWLGALPTLLIFRLHHGA